MDVADTCYICLNDPRGWGWDVRCECGGHQWTRCRKSRTVQVAMIDPAGLQFQTHTLLERHRRRRLRRLRIGPDQACTFNAILWHTMQQPTNGIHSKVVFGPLQGRHRDMKAAACSLIATAFFSYLSPNTVAILDVVCRTLQVPAPVRVLHKVQHAVLTKGTADSVVQQVLLDLSDVTQALKAVVAPEEAVAGVAPKALQEFGEEARKLLRRNRICACWARGKEPAQQGGREFCCCTGTREWGVSDCVPRASTSPKPLPRSVAPLTP